MFNSKEKFLRLLLSVRIFGFVSTLVLLIFKIVSEETFKLALLTMMGTKVIEDIFYYYFTKNAKQ